MRHFPIAILDKLQIGLVDPTWTVMLPVYCQMAASFRENRKLKVCFFRWVGMDFVDWKLVSPQTWGSHKSKWVRNGVQINMPFRKWEHH